MGTNRNIQKIAEQETTLAVNGRSFHFRFFSFRGLTYVDISRGDRKICNGKRVLPNKWLLPSYVAEGIGNIRFETYESDGADYVWYEGFNTKFRLVSYTADEIQEMENSETKENTGTT